MWLGAEKKLHRKWKGQKNEKKFKNFGKPDTMSFAGFSFFLNLN